MMHDQVTLVDSEDRVLGALDKVAAHQGSGRLHRAVSVFLFRRNPQTGELELLVQQRSKKKIVGALQWANTVCGNVWPEESYEACARRRLAAELGITSLEAEVFLQPLYKLEYRVQCNAAFSEHEMDQVFVGWFDGNILPNPEEVLVVDWIPWEVVATTAARQLTGKSWAPWLAAILDCKTIENFLVQGMQDKGLA